MAGQYELRAFLQCVSNTILKDYFQRIGWDAEVEWDELPAKDIGPAFLLTMVRKPTASLGLPRRPRLGHRLPEAGDLE